MALGRAAEQDAEVISASDSDAKGSSHSDSSDGSSNSSESARTPDKPSKQERKQAAKANDSIYMKRSHTVADTIHVKPSDVVVFTFGFPSRYFYNKHIATAWAKFHPDTFYRSSPV